MEGKEMKRVLKRIFALLAALMFLALACLAAAIFWRRGNAVLTISAHDRAFDSGRDVMHARLSNFYDEDVSGIQNIKTVNRSGIDLDEIVLRVFSDAQVSGLSVNGEETTVTPDEDDPTVLKVAYPWKAGEEIELKWHVSAPLTGDVTLISLPVLGVFDKGAWRIDPWDALAQGSDAQAFDWEIWMEYNDDIDVHVGGAVLGFADDPSGCILQARMLGARDMTLLITRDGAHRSREIGGVKVAAVAKSAFAAEKLLDQCDAALSSMEKAGFAYPFPMLTVVEDGFGYEDGYAASCFVAVPEGKSREAQLRCLTRLIARQTFGILVGNDPFNEPWLRQSLSSMAELLAYRARKGENAYQARYFDEIEIATRLTRPYGVNVGAGVNRFGSDAEMTQVLRDQGAAMLVGLMEAMGEEAFSEALSLYVQNNAHRIATRADFEAALETAGSSSWEGYLTDELAY